MLNRSLEKIVFLDIETTSQYHLFSDLPENMQKIFKNRFEKDIKETDLNFSDINVSDEFKASAILEHVYSVKAPLMAELNKIICISIGVIDTSDKENYKMIFRSFCGKNEKELLLQFIEIASIKKFAEQNSKDRFCFCAHNGMVFDFPIIARRLIYNQIDLPAVFDFADKKPWDIEHLIDTKNVWRFGNFGDNISLDMLAAAFNVESSKQLMDGSQVKDKYWIDEDLKSIQEYCEADVLALARVFLKMKNIQVPLS